MQTSEPLPLSFASRFQEAALLAARIGVVGMALSMPISRALFNISALVVIAGWICSGHWQQKWSLISRSWVSLACIVLFAVNVASLSWTHPVSTANWDGVRGYSRLLYVPPIITLVGTHVWHRRAWTGLLIGMLFTLGIYLLRILEALVGGGSIASSGAGQGVFYHHIAQGMMFSFLGAYALQLALRGDVLLSRRAMWGCIALAVLWGLISVGQSRTGQLSVLVAYLLVIGMQVPKHLRVRGVLSAIGVTLLMVVFSPKTQERAALALEETRSFKQDGERTSVGARLTAWDFSGQLIRQAPWLGHGAGSYKTKAYEHFGASPICQLGVCDQPHNQFIATATETGLLGLMALLAWIVAPLFRRKSGHPNDSGPIVAFIAIFVVTASFDSSLKIQAQSFFVLTTLALLSAKCPSDISRHRTGRDTAP